MLPPPCSTWRTSWSRVSRVPTPSRAGPRLPPSPPRLWQFRHCLFWSTSAPWSSRGPRPLTYCTGVGTALHASIFGDQGTITPSPASVVTVRTIRMTPRTATGRRFQLFSPVPEMNGTRNSNAMARGGPTSRSTVSVHGEEARERSPRDDRPAQEHVNDRLADDRGAGGDGRADAQPPVGVLVPAQDLAREGHAERAE